MRSSRSRLHAAMAIALMGAGFDVAHAAPTPRMASSGNNRRPTPPRMDTAQAREIAAHNAEVDRRKAEKRVEKRMRTATGSPR